MKTRLRYVILAFAAVMIFCGFKYSNREGSEIPSDGQQMEILHFHGHTYVCYKYYGKHKGGYGDSSYGYGYGSASIVHDPDCKCGKGGGR